MSRDTGAGNPESPSSCPLSTHGPAFPHLPVWWLNLRGGTEVKRNLENQTLTQELKAKFQGLKLSGQQ